MNTANAKHQKQKNTGDSGDLGEKSAPPRPLRIVAGYVTTNGERWLKVARGGQEATVPLVDFIEGGAPSKKARERRGIVVVNDTVLKAFLKLVDVYEAYETTQVVAGPGWHGSLFAYGDGTVYEPEGGNAEYINALNPQPKFQKAGSLSKYWKELTPIIKDQELLLFAFGTAFLAPLLDVVSSTSMAIQNPIFDWCGESTTGKSLVAIHLAGSVFGGHTRETGFGETWYATVGGIELSMYGHNGFLLGLDEANLASQRETERADLIALSVFVLANGGMKNTKLTEQTTVSSRLVANSTSNEPLRSIMSSAKERADATEVRIITIQIPKSRPYGVFSAIPDGFESAAEVADKLKEVVRTNFGHAGRAYIQALVNARAESELKLLDDIKENFDTFLTRIDSSGLDRKVRRRAAPFALAYAGARLARKLGVLPTKDEVGDLLVAYKKVWRMVETANAVSSTGSSQDAKQVLCDYFENQKSSFLKADEPIEMKKAKYDVTKGFLRKGKSGRKELIIPKAIFSQFGFQSKQINRLANSGVLVCEEGRTDNKRKVRQWDSEDKNDRCLVVNLDILLAKR